MKLKIKKLHPAAIIPKYATAGAACFDLHSLPGNNRTFLFPDMPILYRTGLSFEIPEGWVMLIFSRSGHGFKDSIRLSNCTGVIDSDYRGEVMVRLVRDLQDHDLPVTIDDGDRIAQAMLVQVIQWELEEVAELGNTVRGAGGFGSTGSK
jgi:dUTP pyrophosphatase